MSQSHSTPQYCCIDVAYKGNIAVGAGVLFDTWSASEGVLEVISEPVLVGPYIPGSFYLRELPATLAVMRQIPVQPATIVIDGYVWLDQNHERKGLGAHLYEALGRKVPVIGVAKNRFAGNCAAILLRGESRRPLFVTSIGLETPVAVDAIRSMHGRHRIPTLLKQVDQLCRHHLGSFASPRES